MLLASLLGIACGASPLPFNTLGFFIGPLQQEFGWSLRDISLGLTIYGVLGALMAPLFGMLADRHGVRPVALGSLAAFGLVFAGFALLPRRAAAAIFARLRRASCTRRMPRWAADSMRASRSARSPAKR